MAKPSDKSPEMEDVFIRLFGYDRRKSIGQDKCVPSPIGCGGPATEFRDDISRREFTISGLCQKCQDKVFGKGEEEEE